MGVAFPSGGNQILATDVNSDGIVDLVLSTGEGVSVLLGNGNGTFQTPVTSSGVVLFMAAADFNKDGRVDLVVTNGYTSLNIMLGNGDGTFAVASTYSVTSTANLNAIAVADFNQDGFIDVALPSGQIFLGNGNGTLTEGNTFQTSPGATVVSAVDFNGDGIPDLVTGGTSSCGRGDFGTTGISLGNGDGTFQSVKVLDSGGCYYRVSITSNDLNGDGASDLVIVAGQRIQGDTNPQLSVLINPVSGSFSAAELNISGGSGSVTVGDFDRDGNADLLLSEGSVYLGNGNGTLRFLASASLNAVAVANEDFNHDGKLDLASAVECAPAGCSGGGQLLISLGNGDGTFQLPTALSSGGFYAESLAIGDFNRDGALDIALLNNCTDVSCSSGGSVSVWSGNGDGTFNFKNTIDLSQLGFQGQRFPVSVVAGDFNNDGIVDLAVAGSDPQFLAPGLVSILLGNGDGSFQLPLVFKLLTGDGAVAVVAADFNQDGILDLAFANGAACADCTGHGSIMYGKGDGTFVAGPDIPTSGGPPVSIVTADFYGIGAPTSVLANHCGDVLDCPAGSVMIDGTVNQTDIMLLFLAVGDFNNDGKPDLAGSLQYDSGASILLNVGASAAATTMTLSPSTPQSYSVFQPATFTAQIHHTGPGSPTGTVNFSDNGVSIGSVQVDGGGRAATTTSALTVGSHFIVPYYSGDNSFAPSNSLGVRATVAPASTMTIINSNADPSYLNQSVTFTAKVTSQSGGTLDGSVTFKQGRTTIASVPLSNGEAVYTITYPTTGVRQITAIYSGDSNDAGSTSAVLKQIVNNLPAVTTTRVSSSGSASFINQPVTFTATITSTYGPIPNGEIVTFYDGITSIGTGVTAAGATTFTTSSLSAKTHTIKASYLGDGSFKASSGTVHQVVNLYLSTTTLTSSPNPSTKGQPVTLTATVQSSNANSPTGRVIFKNGTQNLGSGVLSGGVATLNTSKLPLGSNSLTAVYDGDTETSKSISGIVIQGVN
jgi:hypothetical protein